MNLKYSVRGYHKEIHKLIILLIHVIWKVRRATKICAFFASACQLEFVLPRTLISRMDNSAQYAWTSLAEPERSCCSHRQPALIFKMSSSSLYIFWRLLIVSMTIESYEPLCFFRKLMKVRILFSGFMSIYMPTVDAV